MLRALIQEHGTKKWALIANYIQTKSSKQCRRRWKNNVDMEAKATTWTASEDAQLVKFHRELGNKWTQISKRFGDRTDNAVKNRWHALCKKQPELAEEESPVTTVGVRRGTRTRQLTDDDEYDEDGNEFSTDDSGESERKRAKKRPRRGAPPTGSAGGPGGGGGGTRSTSRGTTSLTERSSGRQPSRLGPYAAAAGAGAGGAAAGAGASGATGGGGSGIALLPTPFDRVASKRGGGASDSIPPVSIVVPPGTLTQQELLMAQQLNAKGTPFQIEVAELPRDGTFALNALLSSGVDWIPDSLRLSDGSGSGGQAGDGGAGGGTGGGRAVIQGALPPGISTLNSGAVGGFGGTIAGGGGGRNTHTTNTATAAATTTTAAANIHSTLSINDLLNWLNSTTAELPSGDIPGGVAGGTNNNNNNNNTSAGGDNRTNRRGAAANNNNNNNNNNNAKNMNGGQSDGSGKLSTRKSSRTLTNSGSLHPSLSSGSSGLSSGQRDLLARLFSQVRDSAEIRQQQWQQHVGGLGGNNGSAGGGGGAGNSAIQNGGGDALMMFLDQPGGANGTASDFQRMLSLGLGGQRSLSLGFGAAAAAAAGMGSLPLGSLHPFGSLHSNLSGRTRSSSGRGTSAFTDAADAAIAAIDNEARNKEAAMAATVMAQALVRQHSGRNIRRSGTDGGGGGGNSAAASLGLTAGGSGHRPGLSDVPVIAAQYTAQDIDTLVGTCSLAKGSIEAKTTT
jgi:Myb-like DNA-binding domain